MKSREDMIKYWGSIIESQDQGEFGPMGEASRSGDSADPKEFLLGTVSEFVRRKLPTKDVKDKIRLDDEFFDRISGFSKKNGLDLQEFAAQVDLAWEDVANGRGDGPVGDFGPEELEMFRNLGTSSRETLTRLWKETGLFR